MKRLAILLVVVFAAMHVAAENVTHELLSAKNVKHFIRVKVLPNFDVKTKPEHPQILKYAIDSFDMTHMKPLEKVAFRVDDPVVLLLANHNPLLEVYPIELTSSPNPNAEALKSLFQELETLQKSLPLQKKTGGGGDEDAQTQKAAIAKLESAADRAACTELLKLIEEAVEALEKKELDAQTFANRINKAEGFQGVTDLRGTIETARTNITKNNKTARDKMNEIIERFGSKPGQKPKAVCSLVDSQLLVNYTQLVSTAEAIIAKKEHLDGELGLLHKSLDKYADDKNWSGPTDPTTGKVTLTDYIAASLAPTDEEDVNVAISMKTKTVTFDPGTASIKTAESKDPVASANFKVRVDSFFTIETAAAAVYNTLKYPQYGTGKDANGNTIVKRTEDHDPIDAAIMFNFIPRLGGGSLAYPMFQLGFSSAKDFPGLLAGVGLRILGRYPVGLSVGGMITRYKDLDGELKENDPVEGTAQINEHLKLKTSPVEWYGAIQVKF